MPDVHFREIQNGLRELGLTRESRVIVHISLSALGTVRGGAETLVGALTGLCQLVMMPTFTYQCMVYPLVGPMHNGMSYTDHERENAEAEIFSPDTPAHADMGIAAETLRRMTGAGRSTHPLLSFAAAGVEAHAALATQTLAEPFGPIGWLLEKNAEVLLLGVGHSVNTSIHYGEFRAGRKQFVRWALTKNGAAECPNWPGCSAGFEALAPHLQKAGRATHIGQAHVQRLPMRPLVEAAERLVRADALALLCNRVSCERCSAVRAANNPLALVR